LRIADYERAYGWPFAGALVSENRKHQAVFGRGGGRGGYVYYRRRRGDWRGRGEQGASPPSEEVVYVPLTAISNFKKTSKNA
jgi:hypothetical protein